MAEDHITLGPCHYDIEETAVAVAVHSDGAGWIPVCDDHKKQAEKEGYEIRPDINDADHGKVDGAPSDDAPSDDSSDTDHDEDTEGDKEKEPVAS